MEPVDKPDASDLLDVDHLPVAEVALRSLAAADSPRRSGESPEHVRRLAESEVTLPPILVHRSTMRIVDGMHRLRAAMLRGHEDIEVRYIDGDEASAFVLAVRANIAHGLPLTVADRKAAAARIMDMYPHWSDRMIARVTGLAARTVAAGRQRLSEDKQQLDTRVGRDGRVRPVNGAARREIAARLMSGNPAASLRDIARRTGLSPETVRSVRAQMDAARPSGSAQPDAHATADRIRRKRSVSRRPGHGSPSRVSALQALRADPAFRSNEFGRSLLRMLSSYLILEKCRSQFIENVPAHCLNRVAEAARTCAQGWQDFAKCAEELESFRSP